MNPAQEIQMYDFEENLITVKMLTLVTWTVAYRCYVQRKVNIKNIRTIVRKALKVPRGYPDSLVLLHLEDTKADIDAKLAAMGAI